MNGTAMNIVILGLSITSSWGNGHATTYRSLVRELSRRGHDVLFLERDMPWYAAHRDAPFPYGTVRLYHGLEDLRRRFTPRLRAADFVMVGSYVPDGIEVIRWVNRTTLGVKAFYDIDTPVTLSRLQNGNGPYLSRDLIPQFDLYLSFTGGPILERIARRYGARRPRAFYCSFDPRLYSPAATETRWDLGYMGTYSADRQPALEELLLKPARKRPQDRFTVAGPLYPDGIRWPRNVERVEHVHPDDHRSFYGAQRFTLNVTRAEMVRAGWSPSVRLFEAAGCATAIVSDYWEGIEEIFTPGRDILIARTAGEVIGILRDLPERDRLEIGRRARRRVLEAHTAAHRARELEAYIHEALGRGDAKTTAMTILEVPAK